MEFGRIWGNREESQKWRASITDEEGNAGRV
jgi:hypothetical protein